MVSSPSKVYVLDNRRLLDVELELRAASLTLLATELAALFPFRLVCDSEGERLYAALGSPVSDPAARSSAFSA